uniref:Uncharacterized protein n=1 Tax=Myotis myotis TaxID=51298 RepID=A0A7J7TIW3_MYOMY|nr:hypothetical protein mMyoMyo1_009111 [Myotis myotis]
MVNATWGWRPQQASASTRQSRCTSSPSAPSFPGPWLLPVPHAPDIAQGATANSRALEGPAPPAPEPIGVLPDPGLSPGTCSRSEFAWRETQRYGLQREGLLSPARRPQGRTESCFPAGAPEKARPEGHGGTLKRKGGAGVTGAPPPARGQSCQLPESRAGAEAAGEGTEGTRRARTLPAVPPTGLEPPPHGRGLPARAAD